jgi:hypothetical protein
MKAMFADPVLETIELITQQWQQLKKLKKVKVKVCIEPLKLAHFISPQALIPIAYLPGRWLR